jgi:hypothetical protein
MLSWKDRLSYQNRRISDNERIMEATVPADKEIRFYLENVCNKIYINFNV